MGGISGGVVGGGGAGVSRGYLDKRLGNIYSIGTMGAMGAGVGVCPDSILPSSLSPMAGTKIIGHDDYGNYVHLRTGSIVVWVPKFYYRWNHAANQTYAIFTPNDISIAGIDIYATTALAVASGYRLHRAFVDGGVEKSGVFVDKWKMSKVAVGSGFAAASIRNGLPLSSAADHNPVAAISACGTNNHYQFLAAAKGRDSANGEFDQNCPWFEVSVFISGALAMLAMAHGQASQSSAFCAWYDPAGTTNFPKGCNNNALKDTNDTTVVYQSDGYSNCGRTGSGSLVAKTTHNGQNCGVADINGLMWEVLLGMTCIATSKPISGVAKTNPARLTVNLHGWATGTVVQVEGIVGPTALNAKMYTMTAVDANTISLDGVDGSALPDWTSGGTLLTGTLYLAKESVRMRDFTAGQTLATDHWGATGVAAMMQAIAPPFPAPAGGISTSLKIGNGTNRVFASDSVGDAGIPMPTGVSVAGSTQFGQDYYNVYFRDLLCAIGCGSWSSAGNAGASARLLSGIRTNSSPNVSGRAACYPDDNQGE